MSILPKQDIFFNAMVKVKNKIISGGNKLNITP
jgi:hypothetical protein